MANRRPEREWIGYVLVACLLVTGMLKTIFFALSMYRSWLIGMHIKAILTSTIYSKVGEVFMVRNLL